MKIDTITLNGNEFVRITATVGFKLRRLHDQFIFGTEVVLGLDFSTGIERQDLPEYYEEILITEPQNSFEAKVAEIEKTQNNIITVLNERGLL